MLQDNNMSQEGLPKFIDVCVVYFHYGGNHEDIFYISSRHDAYGRE